MDRTERFYRIEQMLRERSAVPVGDFLAELGVSIATFKRDVEYMRDRLRVPVVWDRASRGYRLDRQGLAESSELPGLWFNASEIHALFTMRRLLQDLQPGLLEPHVRPLLDRLNHLIGTGAPHLREVEKRVRVFQVARRAVETRHFANLATALFERRQLHILHFNRASGDRTERTVSPQRLVYYRENWYLDAWCHWREAIRSFAVDALEAATPSPGAALDIPEAELDRHLGTGYGIFSGAAVQWAVLRFSPERARWVSREVWHPQQRGGFEADGGYRLEIPYSDDRELVMDILRHGAEVEVLGPESLRERLGEMVGAMARKYA